VRSTLAQSLRRPSTGPRRCRDRCRREGLATSAPVRMHAGRDHHFLTMVAPWHVERLDETGRRVVERRVRDRSPLSRESTFVFRKGRQDAWATSADTAYRPHELRASGELFTTAGTLVVDPAPASTSSHSPGLDWRRVLGKERRHVGRSASGRSRPWVSERPVECGRRVDQGSPCPRTSTSRRFGGVWEDNRPRHFTFERGHDCAGAISRPRRPPTPACRVPDRRSEAETDTRSRMASNNPR